jgi:hypothetical protein
MFSWFKNKNITFRETIDQHKPKNFKQKVEEKGQNCILSSQAVNTEHVLVMEAEGEILLANFYQDGVNEDPRPVMSIKRDSGEMS